MITLFNRIELWKGEGSWNRPDEWLFGWDTDCPNGCLIIEIGFFGITFLRSYCRD